MEFGAIYRLIEVICFEFPSIWRYQLSRTSTSAGRFSPIVSLMKGYFSSSSCKNPDYSPHPIAFLGIVDAFTCSWTGVVLSPSLSYTCFNVADLTLSFSLHLSLTNDPYKSRSRNITFAMHLFHSNMKLLEAPPMLFLWTWHHLASLGI